MHFSLEANGKNNDFCFDRWPPIFAYSVTKSRCSGTRSCCCPCPRSVRNFSSDFCEKIQRNCKLCGVQKRQNRLHLVLEHRCKRLDEPKIRRLCRRSRLRGVGNEALRRFDVLGYMILSLGFPEIWTKVSKCTDCGNFQPLPPHITSAKLV
jgi:hypothetical protein